MTTVQIKEGDQLILACDVSEIASQNEFIQGLVAEAQQSIEGTAEKTDVEGCVVTAIIFASESGVSNFSTSASDRGHAHTEAAIYADGTPVTSDELFAQWVAACEAEGELKNPQEVYEAALRSHPNFSDGWLS